MKRAIFKCQSCTDMNPRPWCVMSSSSKKDCKTNYLVPAIFDPLSHPSFADSFMQYGILATETACKGQELEPMLKTSDL